MKWPGTAATITRPRACQAPVPRLQSERKYCTLCGSVRACSAVKRPYFACALSTAPKNKHRRNTNRHLSPHLEVTPSATPITARRSAYPTTTRHLSLFVSFGRLRNCLALDPPSLYLDNPFHARHGMRNSQTHAKQQKEQRSHPPPQPSRGKNSCFYATPR